MLTITKEYDSFYRSFEIREFLQISTGFHVVVAKEEGNIKGRWLSMGEVCQMLDVNESTLRQWADRGLIRSFRTPGGHRRFSHEDVNSLMEGRESHVESTPTDLREAFLLRIRRRLKGGRVTAPSWLQAMNEEDRVRMRLYGRRLLTVTSDYLAQKRHRPQFMDEVRLIGGDYGEFLSRLHLSLRNVMEAFIFFRNSLIDVISGAAEGPHLRKSDVASTLHQIDSVAEQFLLAMAEAYEAGMGNRLPARIS